MVNSIMDEEKKAVPGDPASTPHPDSENWERVGAIFDAALPIPADRRPAWLDEVCGTDLALRGEIDSLINAYERTGLLDGPALAPGSDALPSASPSESTSGHPSPDQIIGQYRILEKLGEGGMGAVYKAVDTRLDRPVALKLITRFDGTGLEKRRFFREAKAASALNHPNIVTIYEYDSDSGVDFIAMEYIQGVTLDRLIADSTKSSQALIGYVAQVAGALARAHEAGIVHRDLKPTNIMVTPDGIVKVLDFGLAKQVAAGADSEMTGLTIGGGLMGTPAYTSPEQALTAPSDHRSDIFSFGIILYEAAYRTHPFRGTDVLATLNNIAREAPRPPSKKAPAIAPPVAALIDRCLSKDPAARPQSMAEVRAALTSVTSEAKAPAVPVSGSKRLAAFAGFAVIAALAGGGVWYSTRQAAVPMNSLTYTLEARKQGGPVSVASTGETFHFGDKFRLRIESGQTGFLYLINEGPGPNDTRRFWILYPAVSGSAAVAAHQPLETGWYDFDANPGSERLWIAYSQEPVTSLQDAMASSDTGEVKDPAKALRTAQFLGGLGRAVKSAAGPGVQLRAAEPLLGEVIQLRHQ